MKHLYHALWGALLGVAILCGLWLAWSLGDSHRQKSTYQVLAEEFTLPATSSEAAMTAEDPPSLQESSPQEDHPSATSEQQEPAVTLPAPPRHDLVALQAENPDCIGWLTIPHTPVDYPVVWTPSDPEHYLRRDFYGNPASGGTPFLDGRSQPQAEGQNLIVYGHNMLDGSMFKPVLQYLVPNFLVTHQDIYLELGGSQYRYQVVAAVETDSSCPLYSYTDLNSPEKASMFRGALLQATDLDVVHHAPGYLTLSTCNDQGGNSRVLVVAALQGEVITEP